MEYFTHLGHSEGCLDLHMMYIGGRVLIAQCSAMSLFVAWVVTLECCSICCCGSGLVRMKRGPKGRIGGPPLLPRGFSRPFLPPIGYVLTNHSSTGWPNASRRAFETVRLLVHGSSIHPRADPLSFQIFLHFFFLSEIKMLLTNSKHMDDLKFIIKTHTWSLGSNSENGISL